MRPNCASVKHPARPAAMPIASVLDAVPEVELLAFERVVIERVVMGKEMRVLLPAESSLRVDVLTAPLNACLIEWPRIAAAMKVRRLYGKKQQVTGRSLLGMFALRGQKRPDHVDSAGLCVIWYSLAATGERQETFITFRIHSLALDVLGWRLIGF